MVNTVQSIWRKVDVRGPDECWPWKGYRNWSIRGKGGYGRLDICGVQGVYAHRAAYLAANPGSLSLKEKGGIQICHTCDNPICCNPKHMYLGDNAENVRDKVSKGRQARFKSTESPRAKLSEEDVRWIRIQKKHATCKALALLYEVSPQTIHSLLYGYSYQDLD